MMEMMEIVDEHHIEIYLCRRCKISCLFCLVLFVFLNTRVYKNTHSYVKVICLSVVYTHIYHVYFFNFHIHHIFVLYKNELYIIYVRFLFFFRKNQFTSQEISIYLALLSKPRFPFCKLHFQLSYESINIYEYLQYLQLMNIMYMYIYILRFH